LIDETPAERIERKKAEAAQRKEQRDRELLWCSLIAHCNGILLIAAQLDLGYKPDFDQARKLKSG
jgi:hypothetical protein